MNEPKVFCIGWHKTGTTTIGDALLILGYNVVGARLDLAEHLIKGDNSKAIELATQFEAFQDVPWNALYKELDEAFPESKFILTVRDSQKWLTSAKNHFKSSYTLMREWLYGNGVIMGNEDIYLKRYNRHNYEVMKYFENRPNDLLIVNLEEESGWKNICSFLNKPFPTKPFPHSNKSKNKLNKLEKFRLIIISFIPESILSLRKTLLIKLGHQKRFDKFNNKAQNLNNSYKK